MRRSKISRIFLLIKFLSMKLSESSRVKLEEFFRQYTHDERLTLPEIYFHAGRFSGILTSALKIHGITIGRNIFITPEFVFSTENDFHKTHIELAAHEIAHVLQYKREGFVKFIYKYFSSYLRNLLRRKTWDAAARHQAYLEIPFEIEARETATNFVEWNEKRRKEKSN